MSSGTIYNCIHKYKQNRTHCDHSQSNGDDRTMPTWNADKIQLWVVDELMFIQDENLYK